MRVFLPNSTMATFSDSLCCLDVSSTPTNNPMGNVSKMVYNTSKLKDKYGLYNNGVLKWRKEVLDN